MSNETSNTGATLTSYAIMPSIYVGTNMVNNYKHFKNPIKPYVKGFKVGEATKDFDVKKFGDLTKKSGLDTFQRAQFTSESYEAVRSAGISYQKAAKKSAKLQAIQDGSKKISIKDKFFNLFRRKENKINDENLSSLLDKANEAKEAATKNLDKINNAKNATQLRETLETVDEGYKNSMRFINGAKTGQGLLKSFGTQAWDNFKKEFSFKKGNRMNAGFNVAMTAIQFVPNITNKVIPAFKNNGFKAGMTELGQTLVQAGADLASYAAGGALGRTIGAGIGSIVGPMGTFVGGLVGDMVGSMFVGSKVCGAVEKITNKDDAQNTGIAQEEAPQEQIEQAQLAQNIQGETQETIEIQPQTQTVGAILDKYENLPSAEEIRQAANAKAYAKYGQVSHARKGYVV